MQKYSLFKYAPNLNHSFFELFLRIEAKVLSYKDVVEHVFLGYRRKGGKGYTLLYSHARWKGESRWMHQGNEEEIGGRTKFEKEKTMPSATIGLTFLWGLTKKSVLPLLELTKKSIVS